jgi:hypothetical protein
MPQPMLGARRRAPRHPALPPARESERVLGEGTRRQGSIVREGACDSSGAQPRLAPARAAGAGKPADKFRYGQVFSNPIGLDCDSAKTESAAQTLPLSAEQVASGARIELRFVLFQKVTALALFFPANHEGVFSSFALCLSRMLETT